MSDKWAEEFEQALRKQADDLARRNTVRDLAFQIAHDIPPKKRSKYAVSVQIPWKYVYALRVLFEEESEE